MDGAVPRRQPRSRRDAARVVLLLALLEAALLSFLYVSLEWSSAMDDPGRTILLIFAGATAFAATLFGVSLLFYALPTALGREAGGSGRGE